MTQELEVGMPARKHLRQSTLLDFGAEASTSKKKKKNARRFSVTSPTQPKRKRPTTPDSSSDSEDVGAIRFASKVPTSGGTRAAVKRRRIMKVVDSDSGEDASVNSVDESDSVPVRKGKRRQVRSDSSDSAFRPPTSRKIIMAHRQVESNESDEEDMEEEVDKDCE